MSQEYLKVTHQAVVVKVWGDNVDETVILADLSAVNQTLDTNETPTVNIVGVTWMGNPDTVITINRNNETIMTLPCAQAGSTIDFTGQQLPPDTIFNTDNIVIQSTGIAQVYLTLRKVAGFRSTVEYAQYGSYDDESVVGPLAISGAPAPHGLYDLPVPGSGEYTTTISVDTSSAGTPYAPGSNVGAISNSTLGLYRRKFLGNFGTEAGSGINVQFCRSEPGFFGKPDTYVSFGDQNLETENFYTFEWVGYFKAPATGTYNFYISCDDDTYIWIGTPALYGHNTNSNMAHYVSNDTNAKTSNSIQMVGGQYYPIRIQFGEYSGYENCQVFWSNTASSGTAYAGDDGTGATQVWYHDSVTKGHSA